MEMLKRFFTGQQVEAIYRNYIDIPPINELNTIDIIAYHWVEEFLSYYSNDYPIILLSGRGFRQKIAQSIAKKLQDLGFKVHLVQINDKIILAESLDPEILLFRQFSISACCQEPLFIDALWDLDIDGCASEWENKFVEVFNKSRRRVVSVDMPSGMSSCKDLKTDNRYVVRAERTITTLFPRLPLLFSENECYTGIWNFVEIPSLSVRFEKESTKWFYTTAESVNMALPSISRFAHKGDNGRALLISGSYGMMGAAQLSARGALNSGVGILMVHVPGCGVEIMQLSTPEAIVSVDQDMNYFSGISEVNKFAAFAIGPGLGQKDSVAESVRSFLYTNDGKVVIDADALNALSQESDWHPYLGENRLLTPHPLEFDRFVGKSLNSFERLTKLCNFVAEYKTNVLLKGAYTVIATADEKCCFNLAGTPAMAKGGSGDVLTGIVVALIAQGMSIPNAAIASAYVHAKAGERAAQEFGCRGVTALDICYYVKLIWSELEQLKNNKSDNKLAIKCKKKVTF